MKRNPHNDVISMTNGMQRIMKAINPVPFPYVNGYVSTLGGKERPSILMTVSLQTENQWKNGILYNSPYANISIDHMGVLEMFGGCIVPKLRKTKVKSIDEVIIKLQLWGKKALGVKA